MKLLHSASGSLENNTKFIWKEIPQEETKEEVKGELISQTKETLTEVMPKNKSVISQNGLVEKIYNEKNQKIYVSMKKGSVEGDWTCPDNRSMFWKYDENGNATYFLITIDDTFDGKGNYSFEEETEFDEKNRLIKRTEIERFAEDPYSEIITHKKYEFIKEGKYKVRSTEPVKCSVQDGVDGPPMRYDVKVISKPVVSSQKVEK